MFDVLNRQQQISRFPVSLLHSVPVLGNIVNSVKREAEGKFR